MFQMIYFSKYNNTKFFNFYNNNNTTSQCGSRFRGVWGDLTVVNLTSTDIPTRREVDSNRPKKRFCEKVLERKALAEHLKREISVKEAEVEGN